MYICVYGTAVFIFLHFGSLPLRKKWRIESISKVMLSIQFSISIFLSTEDDKMQQTENSTLVTFPLHAITQCFNSPCSADFNFQTL